MRENYVIVAMRNGYAGDPKNHRGYKVTLKSVGLARNPPGLDLSGEIPQVNGGLMRVITGLWPQGLNIKKK